MCFNNELKFCWLRQVLLCCVWNNAATCKVRARRHIMYLTAEDLKSQMLKVEL